MEKFTVGNIVSVVFTFSNLKGKKVRPALVLATVEFDNLILCQITSKSYSSKTAIRIQQKDFEDGNLPVISYARPDKLFTADTSIVTKRLGNLNIKMKGRILQNISKQFT